jgi:hypothetical protein
MVSLIAELNSLAGSQFHCYPGMVGIPVAMLEKMRLEVVMMQRVAKPAMIRMNRKLQFAIVH